MTKTERAKLIQSLALLTATPAAAGQIRVRINQAIALLREVVERDQARLEATVRRADARARHRARMSARCPDCGAALRDPRTGSRSPRGTCAHCGYGE